jgi:hypothetical protein
MALGHEWTAFAGLTVSEKGDRARAKDRWMFHFRDTVTYSDDGTTSGSGRRNHGKRSIVMEYTAAPAG